jgi:hypothetical protein
MEERIGSQLSYTTAGIHGLRAAYSTCIDGRLPMVPTGCCGHRSLQTCKRPSNPARRHTCAETSSGEWHQWRPPASAVAQGQSTPQPGPFYPLIRLPRCADGRLGWLPSSSCFQKPSAWPSGRPLGALWESSGRPLGRPVTFEILLALKN